eukprot:62471-Pyramimonas_sp.AAC.1
MSDDEYQLLTVCVGDNFAEPNPTHTISTPQPPSDKPGAGGNPLSVEVGDDGEGGSPGGAIPSAGPGAGVKGADVGRGGDTLATFMRSRVSMENKGRFPPGYLRSLRAFQRETVMARLYKHIYRAYGLSKQRL